MVDRPALTEAQPFFFSIAAIYAIATTATCLLRTSLRALGVVGPVAVLLCPLLIPADEPFIRAAASILSIDAMFRLIDLLRRGGAMSLKERLQFLAPFPIFLSLADQRNRARRPSVATGGNWPRLIVGGVGFAVCWTILEACSDHAALKANPLLDHTFKLFLFVIAVEIGAQALCGWERIMGFRTKPMVRRTWLSVTPAEFWRRWNDRVHAWLFRHVFEISGSSEHPVRAVWCVCLFSGAFHELMFGIATSRFDGYQFLFFTIQAPMIMVSRRLKTFALKGTMQTAVARGFTILWFWSGSLLFFHGIDRVIPIYYASEPLLP